MKSFIKKKSHYICAFILVLSCALSWAYVIHDNRKSDNEYLELLSSADELFEKKIYDEALEEYKKVLDIQPDNEKAAGKIAYIYFFNKKYDSAISYCEKALRANGSNAEYRILEAKSYEAQKKPKKAIAVLKKAEYTAEVKAYLNKLINSFHITYISLGNVSPWFQSKSGSVYSVCMDDSGLCLYGSNGKKIFSGDYSFISSTKADSRLIPVCEGGEWYYADEKGNRRLVPDGPMTYLGPFSEGYAPASDDTGYFFIDENFNRYGQFEYAYPFSGDYAIVVKDGRFTAVDKDLNPVNYCEFLRLKEDEYHSAENNGLFIGMVGDKWTFFNSEGVRLNAFEADDIRLATEKDGLMAFRDGDKWGFVTQTGIVAIEPQFDDAGSFCRDYAPVCVDGSWGYINKDGEIAVEPQFVDAKPLSPDGKAWVANNGGYSLLSFYRYE